MAWRHHMSRMRPISTVDVVDRMLAVSMLKAAHGERGTPRLHQVRGAVVLMGFRRTASVGGRGLCRWSRTVQGEQRRPRLVRSKSAKHVPPCVGDRMLSTGAERAHVLHKNRSRSC